MVHGELAGDVFGRLGVESHHGSGEGIHLGVVHLDHLLDLHFPHLQVFELDDLVQSQDFLVFLLGLHLHLLQLVLQLHHHQSQVSAALKFFHHLRLLPSCSWPHLIWNLLGVFGLLHLLRFGGDRGYNESVREVLSF